MIIKTDHNIEGFFLIGCERDSSKHEADYHAKMLVEIAYILHTWITYYTELPMKVPITLHRLENPYNAPPPIAITGNRLTRIKAHNFPSCRAPGPLV